MYQLRENDKVRHRTVETTLTVRSVRGDWAECIWRDGDETKSAVFETDELEFAPESIKGMAMAAVRNGHAAEPEMAGDAPETS